MNKDLSNQSEEFNKIFNLYIKSSQNLSSLKCEFIQKEKDHKLLENKLQNLCNHQWEMDPPQYQTSTSWTCLICGAYK